MQHVTRRDGCAKRKRRRIPSRETFRDASQIRSFLYTVAYTIVTEEHFGYMRCENFYWPLPARGRNRFLILIPSYSRVEVPLFTFPFPTLLKFIPIPIPVEVGNKFLFLPIATTCINYANTNNSMLRMCGHIAAVCFRCDVLFLAY